MQNLFDGLASGNMAVYILIASAAFIFFLLIIITFLMVSSEHQDQSLEEAKAVVETLLPDADLDSYDVEKISKALVEEKRSASEFTNFETEQEEKAIISYEELLANVSKTPEQEVTKVTLPGRKVTSHHRSALEELIHQPVTHQEPLRETKLNQTKSYLEDLKLLQRKLK